MSISPPNDKRWVLEQALLGTRPDNSRYPVIKAHFDYLSGATDRALSDFAKHLEQASQQINADRSLMNDIVAAAFGMGALGSVESLLKSQYGGSVHLVIGREEEALNASVVLWSLEDDGSSRFAFGSDLPEHPHADILLKNWIQELPILANFSRQNELGAGCVWLNIGDIGSVPGLAFCDYRSGYHLLPDPVFMQTRAYTEVKATYAHNSISWATRKPVAFWRGQTTGWYNCRGSPVRSWRELPRVQLCQLAHSEAARELLDAGLTGLAQIESEEERQTIRSEGLLKDHVHWREFQRYKLQIDIDGNTNAWASMFTKLCSGSPILKVASPRHFRQWYYDRLVPWHHYVPVEADMSDLVDKVAWLIGHDEQAQIIGKNAYNLAISMSEHEEVSRAIPTIRGALWPKVEGHSKAPAGRIYATMARASRAGCPGNKGMRSRCENSRIWAMRHLRKKHSGQG